MPVSAAWDTAISTTESVVFAGNVVDGPDFVVGSVFVDYIISDVAGVSLGVTPSNGVFVTPINVFAAVCVVG